MSDYPEHDKLSKISDKSQAIGEFVDWLSYEKGVHLLTWAGDSVGYVPAGHVTDLLAEFFEIDQKVIEREKRAMLAALREIQP